MLLVAVLGGMDIQPMGGLIFKIVVHCDFINTSVELCNSTEVGLWTESTLEKCNKLKFALFSLETNNNLVCADSSIHIGVILMSI